MAHWSDRKHLVALQWARLPTIDEVVPRGPADDALFSEIRAVLQRHGALGRFGLTLNHRHFALRPGELILETTDVARRRQRIEPRPAAEIAGDARVIETQWVFAEDAPLLFCVGFCHYDRGHRRIHDRR